LFFKEIELEGNLFGNLAATIRIIEDTANLNRRPKTKFRELQGHHLNCKVYEAKSGVIRVYLFHEEKTGRVIITGGIKDNQEQDVKKVFKIIKDFKNEKQQ